jgi:hypothetical protein
MNWRIFSLNFALVVAEFGHMETSGALRAAIWESLTRNAVIIFRSQLPNALGGTYTNAHVASAISLVRAS